MKTTKNKIQKGIQILSNGSFYCAVFISAGCSFSNYFGNKEKIPKILSGQGRENLISSATDKNINENGQDNLSFSTTDGYDLGDNDIAEKYDMQEVSAEAKESRTIPNTDTTQKDNKSTKENNFLARNGKSKSINTSIPSNQAVSSDKIENRKTQNIIRQPYTDHANQSMVEKHEVHVKSANHIESVDNTEGKSKEDVLHMLDDRINSIEKLIRWINDNKKHIKKNHKEIHENIQNSKPETLLLNLKDLKKQLEKKGIFKDITKDLILADAYIKFLSECIKKSKNQRNKKG